MSRTTVHRYLRVAAFLKANVSLMKQMATLGIIKVYAMTRLDAGQARSLIRKGKAERMSDLEFQRMVAQLRPRAFTRATIPNLSRSLVAATVRLERSINRWQQAEISMPATVRAMLQSRLHAMSRALDRIRRASAAAM